VRASDEREIPRKRRRSDRIGRRPRSGGRVAALTFALLALPAAPAPAATDLPAAEKLLAAGKYAESEAAARQALREGGARLGWAQLLVRTLLITGQRDKAVAQMIALVDRYPSDPSDLETLALSYQVYRSAGQVDAAAAALARLRAAVSAPGASVDSAEELVAAGQAALLSGDEPKAVLATYFEEATKRDARCKSAYLAAGALALDKHDDREAAEWYQRGLTRLGADADLHAGLARAFYESDRKEMLAALDAALHLNPRHPQALLLRAEHEIDGEDYAGARKSLDKVLAVDGADPSAWAFQAVIAHLHNDPAGEARARGKALATFPRNPAVDALIGRKLSQKYRFTEGAAAQRRALAFDPAHLPAKAQLAQDLLRLGQEAEGWKLAEEVHQRDGYDVVAYNLVTLQGNLSKFESRKQGNFVLRMDAREASVYADEMLGLLKEVSSQVDAKYGWQARGPVAVEVFPDQADFAVRTFGMPGGAGYLGVCFGPLITMNSPAGTGAATVSWRSVLWHEYTHVVTLGLTHNKIPRWLSEGISVHEELARDRTWGQVMTPRYRDMILSDELTPIGKLSSAFLSPRTPEHLMFAYYQSALVVEFLVSRYGHEALRAVLKDLGAGAEINGALAARAAPLPELEKGFTEFARKRAEALAPKADFEQPDASALQGDLGAVATRWRRKHPNSIWALTEEARQLIASGDHAKARPLLEKSIQLFPEQRAPDNAYLLLSVVQRKLGETAEERKTLERLASQASDALPAYVRLIELAEAARDQQALAQNADRLLAVNPMSETAWRALGRGLEAAPARERAVAAYEKLLLLEPADQVETRYRLAKLLRGRNPKRAKQHLLEALAEAPRFREGYRLLLELTGKKEASR
jgi:tetratricopeptide (TPR) repeat protein